MSKTNRLRKDKWAMRESDLQDWLKINKPKTIPSAKVYKRKPKHREW